MVTKLTSKGLRVRRPTDAEGQRLVRIVRRGTGTKSHITWRRALIVLASAGGNCGAVTSPDCPVDTATGCHFLETQKPVGAHDNSFSFTGYRAISVTLGSQGLDAFGRLSNGASCSISDDSVGCTARQGER